VKTEECKEENRRPEIGDRRNRETERPKPKANNIPIRNKAARPVKKQRQQSERITNKNNNNSLQKTTNKKKKKNLKKETRTKKN